MDSLLPIFSKKPIPVKRFIPSNNVRDLTSNEPTIRKVRADKKFDIKVLMGEQVRKLVRMQADKRSMTPTAYTSFLLEQGLKRGIKDFPAVSYPPGTSKFYSAKLVQKDIDKLVDFVVEWDYSRRKAAHRIFCLMLQYDLEGYL